ncbi:hypothetical protein BJX68DRAFT_272499 [Aspergillus pseudodeflectus]|uniref:Uncharacterized protein n=1 Tax=Aspergillus pseudodeflectus TaxID=176178 RepID=A0ABR4JG17_9EURO
MRPRSHPTGYKYSSAPQTVNPDLQDASNDISLDIALGIWLVWRMASGVPWWAIRWHGMRIRRLLAYPLPRPFGHLDMAAVQQGSVVALLLTANILPLVLRTRSWATAHLLGIDWSAAAWIHRWVDRMVIIHSVLHRAIAALGDGQPVQAIRQHPVPVLRSTQCARAEPYGRPPDLARFGIVLLIVVDIGIARVFSLIQTLVLASEQHRAMVRKFIVVWQMEDLDNRRWILRFVLYYRRNHKNEPSRHPGTRIRFMEGSVDAAQTIRTYLNTRRGVCW